MSLRKDRSVRSQPIRYLSIAVITAAGLCLLVGSVTRTPDEVSMDRVGAPEQAAWKDGELVPPLPQDPDLRKAAIEQARANAASRPGRVPDVTYHAVRSAGVTEPQFPSDHTGEQSSGTTYIPTAADLATINLKMPDDFELPPDVLREIGATGTIDPATEVQIETSLAQSLIQSFHGIDQTGLTPPDCDLAVGLEHVALVVNDEYAVFDKCGTLLYQNSLANLTNGDLFLFDPKIFYDEWDNRWVMSFVGRDWPTQAARIRLLISSDGTPIGLGSQWWYDYDWTNNGGYWGDYPDIGLDPNAVYVTTNDFNWSSPPVFQRARISVLDKDEIYNAAASGRTEFFAMTNPGDGTLAFAIRASEMLSFGSTYYLVNSKSGGGSILTLWEITGAPALPVLNGYNMPVSAYDDPPPLEQPNATYVDCGDARLLTAKCYSARLWTAHAQRWNWGEPDDRSAIKVYIVDTSSRTVSQESGAFGAPGLYYAYPAVDFDLLGRGIVCFSWGGPGQFVGTRYADYVEGGTFSGSGSLVAGQANYAGGAAGTFADPYRWGDYYGCDLDYWGDRRTLWFYGQFASNDPTPSWDTWVGAASFESPPLLQVTPINSPGNPFHSTGLEGGPFVPPSITYTLENLGGSAVTWTLTDVDAWNTASDTQGSIFPGSNTTVDVTVNAVADAFGPGSYPDDYVFTNCLQGGSTQRTTELTVGIDGACPGTALNLIPDAPPDFTAGDDDNDRGVFVTTLKDFEICAIGMRADLELPQTLTARIYSANGTTRGALLHEETFTAVQPGDVIHYIPIHYILYACQEYDIAVEFGATNSWDWWDDRPIIPFDVGGVIRVRDGEKDGGAGNYALPYYSIIGTTLGCQSVSDLDPEGAIWNASTDGSTERGVYITAERTISVCSMGWEANFSSPPAELTAKIYEASGTTRGDLVATGTTVVTATGMQVHTVPINTVLYEGRDYDLVMEFEPTWWLAASENDFPLPQTIDGAIRIRDGELYGNPSNLLITHFVVEWSPSVAGAHFDLAKKNDVLPPPTSTTQPYADYGMYVTSIIDQELYSLGWMADIPEGAVIGARVYEATGTTRGALVSQGSILSSGDGMRWHDIPVSASLTSGGEYDFDIDINEVNEWRWWVDSPGLPYDAYGVITVRDGEQDGNAGNLALIHMRMHACNVTATAIENTPVQPPKFTLAQPFPNPVSTTATIPYSLDEEGPLAITVYDVQGRRVATLMNDGKRPAGPGTVELNAEDLASGVYFVKMQAKTKSVARKITIIR